MKNVCFFTGNITRDIELRHTPNGKAVTDFSIAVNKRVGDREVATFLDIVAWEEQAELIAKFFKKGKPIEVMCEALVDSWTDKESGNKRNKVKFNLLRWEFTLNSKPKDDDTEEEGEEDEDDEEEVEEKPAPKKAKPAPKTTPKPTPPKKSAKAEDLDDDDSDLDF